MFLSPWGERLGEGVEGFLLHHLLTQPLPRGERSFKGRRDTLRDRYINTAAPPVSTFVFVSRLVRPGWLFEIDAMAVIDG